MKIAVFHNLPAGGAIKSTQELISRIANNNSIDVYTLSCSADNGYALHSISKNSYIFDFNLSEKNNLKFISPLIWIYDLYRLDRLHKHIAKIIDSRGYDICITHNCQFFETPSIHKYLSTRTVLFSRSTTYSKQSKGERNPLTRLQNKIIQRYKQSSIASKNKIITNSNFMREELYRLYGVESQVCYVAIDTQKDYYPMKVESAYKYILSVGALAPFKGQDFIIRSLAEIPLSIRMELWAVYHSAVDGQIDYLKNLAAEKNVTLKLISSQNTEQLRELYSGAILTVFPSFFEPLGRVPLESMACGTPVVGVDEGGVKETVIDKSTGLLTSRDEKEFAQAILEISENPELRDRMSLNARKHVIENWDWSKRIEEFEALLCKLME